MRSPPAGRSPRRWQRGQVNQSTSGDTAARAGVKDGDPWGRVPGREGGKGDVCSVCAWAGAGSGRAAGGGQSERWVCSEPLDPAGGAGMRAERGQPQARVLFLLGLEGRGQRTGEGQEVCARRLWKTHMLLSKTPPATWL